MSLRSGNGSQLTSKRYEEYIRTSNIRCDKIHASTPEEDDHTESYFGRFNEDYLYVREFSRYDELNDYIERAVNNCNLVRPHSSLNFLTPEEFERRIKADRMFRKE